MEQISKTLNAQGSLEEKMFGELSELSKTQADQVTRTVAYSTNQVMKLHQDITNISNALMAVKYVAPNGRDPGNATTTTTTVSTSINDAIGGAALLPATARDHPPVSCFSFS